MDSNSKLNIFLWNFVRTLTVCSMLLMVLSIFYPFIASEDDGNRGGVLSAIIVVFGLISYSFIIPNLAQIAAVIISAVTISAVAIPYDRFNKHLVIRGLNVLVFIFFGCRYPFLIYFWCSSLMAGLGLWKLYGDDGRVFRKVLHVIFEDALQILTYVFCMFKRGDASLGKEWLKTGIARSFLGLAIMTFILRFLPSLMEPGEKKMNATATSSIPCEKMAEAPIPGVKNEDI